jgi:hypothetical protein
MKAKTGTTKRATKQKRSNDRGVSYDEFKEYEGQRYTGMKIGRSHKWRYDQGEWLEKKLTPDLWQISYEVEKRRAGRAPEGSGVPVGTEYHWYIVAHQNVTKLNANDYSTSMTGLKFKVAHKRAGAEKWSATPKTQRKRMLEFLRSMIEDLEAGEEAAARAEAETPRPSRAPVVRERVSVAKPKRPAKPTTKSATRRRKSA